MYTHTSSRCFWYDMARKLNISAAKRSFVGSSASASEYTCMYVYIDIYTYTYVSLCIYMYIHIYLYMYIHIYIYIYIHIFIFTYTYTYINRDMINATHLNQLQCTPPQRGECKCVWMRKRKRERDSNTQELPIEYACIVRTLFKKGNTM